MRCDAPLPLVVCGVGMVMEGDGRGMVVVVIGGAVAVFGLLLPLLLADPPPDLLRLSIDKLSEFEGVGALSVVGGIDI